MFDDPDLARAASNLIAAHGADAATVARRRSAVMEHVGLKDVAHHWQRVAAVIEQVAESNCEPRRRAALV